MCEPRQRLQVSSEKAVDVPEAFRASTNHQSIAKSHVHSFIHRFEMVDPERNSSIKHGQLPSYDALLDSTYHQNRRSRYPERSSLSLQMHHGGHRVLSLSLSACKVRGVVEVRAKVRVTQLARDQLERLVQSRGSRHCRVRH